MSKFKVGDKLKVIQSDACHGLFSEGDIVTVVDTRSDGDVKVTPGKEGWWYLGHRFEHVEDVKPSHGFKIGDCVEYVGETHFAAPHGVTFVSDLIDVYVYVGGNTQRRVCIRRGNKQGSRAGWRFSTGNHKCDY